MNLSSSAVELANALKSVHEAWEEIRAEWDDPVSRAIHEDTIDPLEKRTAAVLNAMDRLSPILQRALRDVS